MIKMTEKTKKDSLDLLLNQNDAVFLEGVDSPRYALTLFDCLKNFDKQVNEKYLLSTTTNDAQIKGTQ